MVRKSFAVAAMLMMTTACARAELSVGDDAPPLTVSRWLKGEPVKEIESGKIYVMEFWATWCGPCRAMIPHLSELQKNHPDVVFISTSVWEEDDSAVDPFFKEVGPGMDYRVAVDDKTKIEKGAMATNWLTAAGRHTIPSAFLVNKDKKVVWIGHPARLGAVLDKVIAGNFDIDAAKAEWKKQVTEEKEMAEIQEEFGTTVAPMLQDKDYAGADRAIEAMALKHPNVKAPLYRVRFLVNLQGKNYDVAYQAADQFADLATDAEPLNELAWRIVATPGVENRDLDRALKYATKANDLAKGEDAQVLDTLARIHADKNDIAKAVEYQEKAVSKSMPDLKASMEETLAKYKERAAAK